MSDTPETDKLITDWIQGDSREIPDFVLLARRLERERNEAIRQRNETNESSKYAVDYAIREREKMLEALMKIEDVFVDGEDTYEGWRTMGNIARAALEGKV
jgi:hypothetical protein